MPEFFPAETVVQDKFVFISYSHEDKPFVAACAGALIDSGVRLWYDRALDTGDLWNAIVESLLRHENCCGALLFCSPSAIISENVAKERAIALEEQTKRGKSDYPLLLINISDTDQSISYMQLLKKSFDLAEKTHKDFKLETLRDYMQIVGGDPICIMSSDEDCADKLLASIKKKLPLTINKSLVMLEKLEEVAQKGSTVHIPFGQWTKDGVLTPIHWHLLYNDGETGILLCEDVLSVNFGRGLEQWLNSEFKATAFSQKEADLLCGDIRLLSADECEKTDRKLLCKACEWWLSDTDYNDQMVVDDDGYVYTFGYNNTSYKRGVRPVIAIRLDNIKTIMDAQS